MVSRGVTSRQPEQQQLPQQGPPSQPHEQVGQSQQQTSAFVSVGMRISLEYVTRQARRDSIRISSLGLSLT
jgi:hypothetical protein